MTRTRILIADSLTIFSSGVRTLLERESDFHVIEAGTYEEVARVAENECPDIALIDLDLPPEGGVAAVEKLTELCSCHTIVWSFDPTRETVFAAIRAGASGYLEKKISPNEIPRNARTSPAGAIFFSR